MPKLYFVLLLAFFGVLLLAFSVQSSGDSVTDGTKLVSTFLVHRHGDRTPLETSMLYSTNKDALEVASIQYGYGQLTDLGKRRSYNLGKFIRARYGELLSPQYNSSEIYVRSTDSLRAKMTVLTALAAIYPAYPGSWSNEVNWNPVPYTTVPAKYDFNIATISCPVFTETYHSVKMADNSRMSKFKDVLNTISEQIDYNVTTSPVLTFLINEVFIAQQSLGVYIGDTITAIMPEIKDAADVAIDILFGDENHIALQAGPLLNDFFKYTAEQMSGADTPRVRIYSAHDFNVYSIMAVSQITPRQGIPKYNAAFALELRQVIETGQYVVLPVYLPEPGADVIYLQVAGCDSLLCPYDTYKEIVSPYFLDETTWRSKCDFTEDIDFDYSDI